MRSLGILAIWTALAAVASAGDWTYWRGPEMVGVSRETGLPSDWSLEPKKNVVWSDETGGRATPVILNDRIYLAARTSHSVTDRKELIDAGEQVICRDAKTGEVIWKDVFPVYNTDIPGPRVGWASLTGDPETGNIYHHSVSGTFRCYSADGKRLWEHSLLEEYGEITGYGGRITTPIVDEDRVILGIPCQNWGSTGTPPPKHTFYAFDKNTGELLWAQAPGGAIKDTIYTNPVITVIDGVRQLICGNADGGIYGINARTGEKLWGFAITRRGILVSPVVEGKYVYITQGEDNIDTTEFGRVQCIDASLRGDLTEKGSVWRVNGVRAGYVSPAIHDGILYVVDDSANLIAFDAKDGTRLWDYKLGTIGRGAAPVVADGKLYVMEVNGRIHIVKPSREKCEKLSEVVLPATGNQQGADEIWASPAISNGRVFFVTRDRTICIGDPSLNPADGDVPPMAEELEPQQEVASLQLIPYETIVKAGESVEYEVRAFDKNGRFLKKVEDFTVTPDAALKGATAGKNVLTTSSDTKVPQAGVVTVEVEGQTATARVRSFPPLPWTWGMEDLADGKSPSSWVNATGKLKATKVEGNTVLVAPHGPGKPAFSSWLGAPEMKDYVIQADVKAEGKRQLSAVGVTNQGYDMVLKTNSMDLALQTWSAHLRINETQRLKDDPANKWFTMKFYVSHEGDGVVLRGKFWPKGDEEPADWTIEAKDPNPIPHGSPGLYVYRLRNSEAFFDNVIVSEPEHTAASK